MTVYSLIFLLLPGIARAGCQCMPLNGGNAVAYDCTHEGGVRAGCARASSSGSSSGSSGGYSSPDYDYGAAQRAQEAAAQAERDRLEKERIERERIAREAREERLRQEQFERDKQAALCKMKGISCAALTIKDHTGMLKGVGNLRDTGIKSIRPEMTSRDLATAWKQLHCAAAMADMALSLLGEKSRNDIDIDELHLVASEGLKALNGEALGVECPAAPRPPKPYGEAQIAKRKQFYVKLLTDTVRAAGEIKDVEPKLREAESKKEHAEQLIASLKDNSVRDSSAKASTEKPALAARMEKGKTAAPKDAEQQGKEDAMSEALAALREAQRVINQQKARRSALFYQLNQNQSSAKADWAALSKDAATQK